MDVRNLEDVEAFVTKDGSEIRELLAHRNSVIEKQSLAEARLLPGCSTAPHFHRVTEEIYYIVSGQAEMRLGDAIRTVGPGDAIAIPPGQVHQITNTADVTLHLLCCCAPAYEHGCTSGIVIARWQLQGRDGGVVSLGLGGLLVGEPVGRRR